MLTKLPANQPFTGRGQASPAQDSRIAVEISSHGEGVAGELRLRSIPLTGSYAYVDVLYVARNIDGGMIKYECADFTVEGRVLPGGSRSHSLAIPLAALRKSRTIGFSSSGPLAIESAVLRSDYYDFMGLRSADPTNEHVFKSEWQAMERAQTIGLSMQWFVTWKCNFTCAYCWQEVAADQYRRGKLNKIAPEAWAARFHRLHPRSLNLTGGEPSLYKKLPEFIGLLDPAIELSMYSNLGRSLVLERFQEHVQPDRFRQLTFSIHPTQFPLAEFFDKLGQLKRAGYKNLCTEMVLYPQNLPLAGEVVERCRDLQVSLRFDPYVPASEDSLARDEKMLAQMKDWTEIANEYTRSLGEISLWSFEKFQYFEINSPREPQAPPPVGRLPIFCTAGSRRINVDEIGDVYTCMSAIDRSKLFDRLALPHYAPLGNVFDDDFQLLEHPIMCWESFRCSACDFQVLDRAWTRVSDTLAAPPLPE